MYNTLNNIDSIQFIYLQKIIPLVFDNSMSMIELLYSVNNKITELINNNNNQNLNIEQLEKEFTALKTYTENYFTDLNIQNEINNKIQSMVDSGEFSTLLNVGEIQRLEGMIASSATLISQNASEIGNNKNAINALQDSIDIQQQEIDSNATAINEIRDTTDLINTDLSNQLYLCDTAVTYNKKRVITMNPEYIVDPTTGNTWSLASTITHNNKVYYMLTGASDTSIMKCPVDNNNIFSTGEHLTTVPGHGNSSCLIPGTDKILMVFTDNTSLVIDTLNDTFTQPTLPIELSGVTSDDNLIYGKKGDILYHLSYDVDNNTFNLDGNFTIEKYPHFQLAQGLGIYKNVLLAPLGQFNSVLVFTKKGKFIKNLTLTGASCSEIEDINIHDNKLMATFNIGNPNYNNGLFSYVMYLDIDSSNEIGGSDVPITGRGNPFITLYDGSAISVPVPGETEKKIYLRDGIWPLIHTENRKDLGSVLDFMILKCECGITPGAEKTIYTRLIPANDLLDVDAVGRVEMMRTFTDNRIRSYAFNYNISTSDNAWIGVKDAVALFKGTDNNWEVQVADIKIISIIGIRKSGYSV